MISSVADQLSITAIQYAYPVMLVGVVDVATFKTRYRLEDGWMVHLCLVDPIWRRAHYLEGFTNYGYGLDRYCISHVYIYFYIYTYYYMYICRCIYIYVHQLLLSTPIHEWAWQIHPSWEGNDSCFQAVRYETSMKEQEQQRSNHDTTYLYDTHDARSPRFPQATRVSWDVVWF